MVHTQQTEADRIRSLAQSLDCITDDDFRLLAGITEQTEAAWRKRHTGPAYVLIGTRYLYPRAAVATFLQTLVRERKRGVPAGAML